MLPFFTFFLRSYVRFMQGLTENHILWRGLPVKRSYLFIIIYYLRKSRVILLFSSNYMAALSEKGM